MYSENFSDNDYKLLNNEFITIGVIPWFHAYGCITLIGMCISGHRLLFYKKFDEIPFLSGIEVILLLYYVVLYKKFCPFFVHRNTK